MDANTYYTNRYHTEQTNDQLSTEDYIKEHLPHTDIQDLTEALAKHSTAQVVDSFRKGNAQDFYNATLTAVLGYLERRADEDQ